VSDTSAIEWTDATWNPVTGCSKVSPGCAHCYAEALTLRFHPSAKPWTPENAAENVGLHPERLDAPLRWRSPRRVFVNSMSDLFHELVPDDFIDRVFAVMALAQRHTFQILTKRPERMQAYCSALTRERLIECANLAPDGTEGHAGNPNITTRSMRQWRRRWLDDDKTVFARMARPPLPNVWLGVSVENQRWADERIPLLLQTPAALRFISAEPLLGPVDLRPLAPAAYRLLSRYYGLDGFDESGSQPERARMGGYFPRLDWVIVGGESGPKHRPMDLAWARSLRDQCRPADVAFFMKQLGGTRPGTALDELPEDLRIREFSGRQEVNA
jgi:protein gp37